MEKIQSAPTRASFSDGRKSFRVIHHSLRVVVRKDTPRRAMRDFVLRCKKGCLWGEVTGGIKFLEKNSSRSRDDPSFHRIDFIPHCLSRPTSSQTQADTSGEPLCLLHVDSLSVSRTPVGYCARNHRWETMRECTSPMRGRTHACGSGRTLWNGMRGRRVGAWAAAGRTHVRRPERDSPAHLSPVVCHETEFERGMHGGKKRKRKMRGREKERKRTWNKEGRSSSYVPAYGKGYREERRERKRARTRIDGKYRAQEHDPQPVRNKRSFIWRRGLWPWVLSDHIATGADFAIN